jgi:hypothetical protein
LYVIADVVELDMSNSLDRVSEVLSNLGSVSLGLYLRSEGNRRGREYSQNVEKYRKWQE